MNEEPFFNTQIIQNKKIKTVTVTYFDKKELKGIFQIKEKSNQYSYDSKGKLVRSYSTKKISKNQTDTLVEWRYYNNNRLQSIKKGKDKTIAVRTIFYEENKPSIHILATSINESQNKTILKVKNYREESAEYINYRTTPNGDSITEWSYTGNSIFKIKTKTKKDSTTFIETINYTLENKAIESNEYSYQNDMLSKLIRKESNLINHYQFQYNKDKELIRYIKFKSDWVNILETSELLYDSETGNLKAILTKNYKNNSIKIRKFNYTYF